MEVLTPENHASYIIFCEKYIHHGVPKQIKTSIDSHTNVYTYNVQSSKNKKCQPKVYHPKGT